MKHVINKFLLNINQRNIPYDYVIKILRIKLGYSMMIDYDWDIDISYKALIIPFKTNLIIFLRSNLFICKLLSLE